MKYLNTDTNTRETVSSHYLVIDGQRIPLTDELRKLHNKEINDARNRARREHSCANPDYHSCHGDCARCRYHVQGNVLSMDDERYAAGFATGVNAPVNAVPTSEEIFCAKEAVRDLYAAAARVVKNGDRILHMTYVDKLSTYEIARELSLSQRTAYNYQKKVIDYIKAHRSDFVDW